MIIERNKIARNFIIISILMPVLAVLCLGIPLVLTQVHFSIPNLRSNTLTTSETLQGFSTILLSIILEAFPFIMVGTILSSTIQIFVTEETLAKIIPKNKFLGLLCAALIGLVLPICDCAIVPIVRRLIKKGMPLYIGITFMLSVPIVNPVVLISTYYAFLNNIYAVIIRGGLGIVSAMIIGNLIDKTSNKSRIFKNLTKADIHKHEHSHEHEHGCACGCEHHHHDPHKGHNIKSIITEVVDHTTIELHDVGKFIIIGSFLSALMLSESFKSRFIIKLIFMIFVVCFSIGLFINFSTFKEVFVL